ncbi:MAG: glycoside hydrolase family 88 protein [candidate division KSB1 bacterium]|nr:glycoside hydrolase family 88 protein [candidate division KSB1 bacterium]
MWEDTSGHKRLAKWSAVSLCTLIIAFGSCERTPGPESQDPLFWATRVAETVMKRQPAGYGDWDYVTGTVLRGFEELWRVTNEERYFSYLKATVDRAVKEDGEIAGYNPGKYSLDDVQEGRLLLFLFKQTGEQKYAKAAQQIREQIRTHPRNALGGLWHKAIYPHQMWLDGLYMAQPFCAEFAAMYGDSTLLEDVFRQFELVERHLRDARTGLYYHGWDHSRQASWADPATGVSPSFWARALGWYMMALVDVLDFVPESHPRRGDLIKSLGNLAQAVRRYQDARTGLWFQVIDQGTRSGNYLESSASAMFVYALAKAVRIGYLDKSYLSTARKGFQGLTKFTLYQDSGGGVNLVRICKSAGLGGDYHEKVRDGSYEYYVYMEPVVPNDGKGLGPFLAACAELARLSRRVPH